MKGQSLGDYAGSTDGILILNVDDRGDYFQGSANLNEGDATNPSALALFKTVDKASPFRFKTYEILAVHPITGEFHNWKTIKQEFPGVTSFPSSAEVEGHWDDNNVFITWTTDNATNGTARLMRSQAAQPSVLKAERLSWDEFKRKYCKFSNRRFIFRGQDGGWRLRTSYHRLGRADLYRFVMEDMGIVYKHLSARTKHVFNFAIPDEYGAFMNLVQHHGYPTPLLDWTYSPYVAAFFAYRKIKNSDAARASDDDRVRIHIFNKDLWEAHHVKNLRLLTSGLQLLVNEFIAIENLRSTPQQAVSIVSNVDDIETFVGARESALGQTFLQAVDLPKAERKPIFEELTTMGITAGALFPGLDGACEELAHRNFEI